MNVEQLIRAIEVLSRAVNKESFYYMNRDQQECILSRLMNLINMLPIDLKP